MTTLRVAVAVAALATLLGGCGDSPRPTAPAPGYDQSAELRDALGTAAEALQAGNYTFVVASPARTTEGIVHLPSESARITTDAVELVIAEPNRWVRRSADGPTWYLVDSSRVRPGSDLALELTDPDLVGLDTIVAATTGLTGDPKTITGTVDGARTQSAYLNFPAALPFTANLDGNGRLAELDIETPAGRWVLTVSGYGEQKSQTAPTGKIRNLPSSGYARLNG
ncbi:hypothetical protein GCM10010172_24450 [Paractinoplanes ferrugineus]|uniref:Lipoprotein n=1 Tax=Paractinoplanes ferrugineus TaxID=113564 RepID=A0A919MBP5_9ACTN|nr:hypothetical protein [Actinoplanes ferrugineus]GIE08644.1 hypothetical protein Afe05nite_04840 [Actinoplanes ferrugineus]